MTKKEIRARCRAIVSKKVKEQKLTWKEGCQLFRALYKSVEFKLNQ